MKKTMVSDSLGVVKLVVCPRVSGLENAFHDEQRNAETVQLLSLKPWSNPRMENLLYLKEGLPVKHKLEEKQIQLFLRPKFTERLDFHVFFLFPLFARIFCVARWNHSTLKIMTSWSNAHVWAFRNHEVFCWDRVKSWKDQWRVVTCHLEIWSHLLVGKLLDYVYLPETNSNRPWKLMVGRWSFPFGMIHVYKYMCQGLNSHYSHIIGDKLINPIVRVYRAPL